MIDQKVRDALTPFFPKSFNEKSTFLDTEEGRMVAQIIKGIDQGPISRTQANQLLHLVCYPEIGPCGMGVHSGP